MALYAFPKTCHSLIHAPKPDTQTTRMTRRGDMLQSRHTLVVQMHHEKCKRTMKSSNETEITAVCTI